jgi:hypothetical protein
LLLTLGPGQVSHAQQPNVRDLLSALSSAPASACDGNRDFDASVRQLLDHADMAVVRGLNGVSNARPAARVTDALSELERLSGEINKSWPEESRFHAEVFDVPPAVVVIMTYRERSTFSFFAIPERDASNKPTSLWQTNGLDRSRYATLIGVGSLKVFPLMRGPGGRARFLAELVGAGCAGSISVAYSAYEWEPRDTGDLDEIIRLEGALSRSDPIDEHKPPGQIALDSFPSIGELATAGSRIKLPYCWFSAIDTWDNPSLCAVNTYDLSGDHVRFVSSVYNRPDLLPITKAIEYAQSHDYSALRAYCGSDDVARQLIRDIPPFVFAGELEIKRLGESRESVEFGEQEPYWFEVQRNAEQWLVVSFRME